MNKKYLAVVEWIIAIILLVLCYRLSPLSCGHFSAMKAHEFSEKTMHYGPSKIIKEVDLKNRKVYLCRYKNWISADVVDKRLIKWHSGSSLFGYPIDYTKKVSYTWGTAGAYDKKDSLLRVIGYVNDPAITTMILEAHKEKSSNIETLKYKLDDSHMFIFVLTDKKATYLPSTIKGVDKDGKIVYESRLTY